MARISQRRGPEWLSYVYVAGVSQAEKHPSGVSGLSRCLYAPLLSLPLVGLHVGLDLLGESLVLPQLSLSITCEGRRTT